MIYKYHIKILILLCLFIFISFSNAEAINEATIEAYLKKDVPPIKYIEQAEGLWQIPIKGEHKDEIMLWVNLIRAEEDGTPSYITFWIILARIPEGFNKDCDKMLELYQSLLDVGYKSYLVKMVIDEDNDIGIQAELPIEDLSFTAFIKTLWEIIYAADDYYPRLMRILEIE